MIVLHISQGKQSMDCAANPWFVSQSIDRYFAQDNPWIAQIPGLRITHILTLVCMQFTLKILR